MEERYVSHVTAMPATPPEIAGRGAEMTAQPGTANMPVLPNMQNAPNSANTANIPESATLPNAPNLPNAPTMAQTNISNAENMPNTANRPNSATMPNTANMPNSATMPNTANMSKVENTSNTAAMPDNTNAPKTDNMQSNAKQPDKEQPSGKACTYKQGTLPSCAPLAAGFVPMQQRNSPKYSNDDALTRGTLFPGLDLPFMNVTNKNNPYAGTPRGELLALGFAIHELTLYLDTHKDDKEAFDMLRSLISLESEGQREYTKRYGPTSTRDLEHADHFAWVDGPWPWEYVERTGK